MSRIACVAVVKNEEQIIAEWVSFQFACGFDTVILFDNSSTDGTRTKAEELARFLDVRVLGWNMSTPDYQKSAYEHAARIFKSEFDWLAFFDTDEFLVLNVDLGLHDVLDVRQDAAAIAVPWAIFGSSGHAERPLGLVTENFLYRSHADFGPNRHVKSIIQPKKMISCINPHSFEVDGVYQLISGETVSWDRPGILNHTPCYELGKIHHYFTRSQEDWQRKIQRGYPDNTKRTDNDFNLYDRNEVFDESACRTFQLVKKI